MGGRLSLKISPHPGGDLEGGRRYAATLADPPKALPQPPLLRSRNGARETYVNTP